MNDPFDVTQDVALWPVRFALQPNEVERRFRQALPAVCGDACLSEIRVIRHRPGRRCVILYKWQSTGGEATAESIGLIGKMRAKGLDCSTFTLCQQFRAAGFAEDCVDGVIVPEPLAAIEDWRMWLQRQVDGQPSSKLLSAAGGPALARRMAEAAYKLHRVGIAPPRRHGLADELAILRDRLLRVAEQRPDWRLRIKRLVASCERLANGIPSCVPSGVHRDFYPDQVLVAGGKLYLLDMDLYSAGDPALDIGNFRAHLIEQSLRQFGRPYALAEVEAALVERYRSLAGDVRLEAIEAYTTLSLARHIYISTLSADRSPHTGTILELCEERLLTRSARYISP